MQIPFRQVLACAMALAAGNATAQQRPVCALPYSAATWTNCIGQKTVSDGETYVGSFRNGVPDGEGTYRYPDGSQYVGEVSADQPSGQGTLTYRDGKKDAGGFRRGRLGGKSADTAPAEA